MRPGTAAVLAEQYADSIRHAAMRYVRNRAVAGPYFDWHRRSALGDRHAPENIAEIVNRINGMNPMVATDLVMTGQDVGVLALWDRDKSVMNLDPDLWEELGESPDETIIPEGLFKYLPYRDPFVAFPEPIRLPLDDGGHMLIGGLFVTGRVFMMQGSTHEENADGIGLLIGGETFRKGGGRVVLEDGTPDMLWTRVSIDGDGSTLGEIIERSAEGFVSVALDGEAWKVQMPVMVRRAMATLIYLCATNADLAPVAGGGGRPPKRQGGRTVARTAGPKVVNVGWQVGAALRAYRQRTSTGPATPTGRSVKPHMRRSHPHTFRVGPGRTGFRVKWLAPIPIKMSAPAKVPTVHRAKKGQS